MFFSFQLIFFLDMTKGEMVEILSFTFLRTYQLINSLLGLLIHQNDNHGDNRHPSHHYHTNFHPPLHHDRSTLLSTLVLFSAMPEFSL